MNLKLERKLIDTAHKLITIKDFCHRHVSYLLVRNKVISIGTSKRITHPLAHKYGYRYSFIHSELDCLNKVEVPKGASLVNVRISIDGSIRMSAPCDICTSIIKTYPIKQVWYSTEHGFERW